MLNISCASVGLRKIEFIFLQYKKFVCRILLFIFFVRLEPTVLKKSIKFIRLFMFFSELNAIIADKINFSVRISVLAQFFVYKTPKSLRIIFNFDSIIFVTFELGFFITLLNIRR